MWRNTQILRFVKWLRQHNDEHANQKCGFYGLDLYSMFVSADAVIKYLEEVSPSDAEIARQRYSVLHSIRRFDPTAYAGMACAPMGCL